MSNTVQLEALNCPNCGAAVSSDKTQCEFCRSRLKTVGCPSCLGLMFLGSKFCGHCGAKAVTAEIMTDENSGECPRCKVKLRVLQIDATLIRECERCGGFWAGVDGFEELCLSKEQQSAVLNFIGDHPRDGKFPPVNYVPCPECKQLMNRSNFARSSGVIVDLCRQHGVWFDADELPKIIDFIDSGGLARSREKEKLALDEQRSQIQFEQRKLAAMERRSGAGRFHDGGESRLSGFISDLFDP